MGGHPLRLFETADIFLAVTATLANILILVAFQKESSIHPPSKILLRSLAITDLCVGILSEPLFVVLLIAIDYGREDICSRISDITTTIAGGLCLLSLFSLSAISVDRLLALLLGMRYRQVVTFKRVTMIVACSWTVISSTNVIFTRKNIEILLYYFSITIVLCLIISTCCYIKIYRTLNCHHAQIQEQAQQGQPSGHRPLNIARYRKTVSNALWVQLSVLVCYFPMAVVLISMAIRDISPSLVIAWTFSRTLVFLNSTLNPILYCWNIREVRRSVIETVRQMSCRSSP